MALTSTYDHDQLLTLARKVQAAAIDGNRDRLQAATSRLHEALIDHVGAERVDLLRLPPGESQLLTRGQQRIVDELGRLLDEIHTAGPCQCAASADQLTAELYVQADEERLALADRSVSDTTRSRLGSMLLSGDGDKPRPPSNWTW